MVRIREMKEMTKLVFCALPAASEKAVVVEKSEPSPPPKS
jgi:hypothetical protein